ncbi:MAG TPA: DUF4307 domain-containing protein [Micromonosporaceae bacterium]
MTETRAVPPNAPVFPPGRYGRRREPRRAPRWLVALLVAVVVAAGLAVSYGLYVKYGSDPFTGQVTRYSEVADDHVTVEFQVHRPAGAAGVCGVRARSRDGREVGWAEVPVPRGDPAQRDVKLTYRLATTARAFAVDVQNCRAA